MDLIRSCYRTKIIQRVGDDPIEINWFFVEDDAMDYQEHHNFASLNWENATTPIGAIGEQRRQPRPWQDGANDKGFRGLNHCGTPGQFLNGAGPDDKPLTLDANGRPTCCEGLPLLANVSIDVYPDAQFSAPYESVVIDVYPDAQFSAPYESVVIDVYPDAQFSGSGEIAIDVYPDAQFSGSGEIAIDVYPDAQFSGSGEIAIDVYPDAQFSGSGEIAIDVYPDAQFSGDPVPCCDDGPYEFNVGLDNVTVSNTDYSGLGECTGLPTVENFKLDCVNGSWLFTDFSDGFHAGMPAFDMVMVTCDPIEFLIRIYMDGGDCNGYYVITVVAQ